MVPVKSRKAQLGVMHTSKKSDFQRKLEGKTKALSKTMKLARAAISSLGGFEARPSRAFELLIAAEHARAVMSSGKCEKEARVRCWRALSNAEKPAQAAISSAN